VSPPDAERYLAPAKVIFPPLPPARAILSKGVSRGLVPILLGPGVVEAGWFTPPIIFIPFFVKRIPELEVARLRRPLSLYFQGHPPYYTQFTIPIFAPVFPRSLSQSPVCRLAPSSGL